MKAPTHPFKYKKSTKIASWGCRFDSLTELKYAISIREDYEFLRERVVIYYFPATRIPTEYLRGYYKYYRPDFLVRHKETGEAHLVEIKPREFEGHPQLELRTEIAEKYIKWKGYDWKFKIVFDDEIILNAEQLEDFNECRNLKSRSALTMWYEQYSQRFNQYGPSALKNASDTKMVDFIMFGNTKRECTWRKLS